MLHDGRRYCDALDLALTRAGIAEMTPEVRKLVDRHVAQCDECEERKRKLVAPLAVFGAFAMVGSPAGLKPQILEGLMRQWPGPAAGGGAGSGSAGAAGGPRGLVGSSQNLLKLVAGLGLAAALLLGAVLVPASPLAITKSDGSDKLVAAADGGDTPTPTPTSSGSNPSGTSAPFGGGPGGSPSPSPSPSASPGASPSGTTGPTSTSEALGGDGTATTTVTSPPPGGGTTPTPPTTTPTKTATPTPANTPTPTATPTSIVVPSPTPTNSPPPCNPSLGAQIPQLTMYPGETRSFPLFNTTFCGAANFLAAGGATWLTVSPVQGTIPGGGSVNIVVTVDATKLPDKEGAYTGNVQIDGPNNSVVIPVTVNRGGNPPSLSFVRKSCGVVAPSFALYLSATDDIGVASVVVSYTRTDNSTGQGNATHGNGNSWAFSGAFGVKSYSAVAYDGAGNASAPVTGTCP